MAVEEVRDPFLLTVVEVVVVVVLILMIPKNLMSVIIPATVMGNATAVSADDELVTTIHSDESMSFAVSTDLENVKSSLYVRLLTYYSVYLLYYETCS